MCREARSTGVNKWEKLGEILEVPRLKLYMTKRKEIRRGSATCEHPLSAPVPCRGPPCEPLESVNLPWEGSTPRDSERQGWIRSSQWGIHGIGHLFMTLFTSPCRTRSHKQTISSISPQFPASQLTLARFFPNAPVSIPRNTICMHINISFPGTPPEPDSHSFFRSDSVSYLAWIGVLANRAAPIR